LAAEPIPEQHEPSIQVLSTADSGQGRHPRFSRQKIAEDQSLDPVGGAGRDDLRDERRLPAARGALRPSQQIYRVLTGQERSHGHFGLVRADPEKPCPTIPKSLGGSTTGLVHPRELRRLTTDEIKALTSFPEAFALRGSYRERWARIGNSVPPLFMRAIALHVRGIRPRWPVPCRKRARNDMKTVGTRNSRSSWASRASA